MSYLNFKLFWLLIEELSVQLVTPLSSLLTQRAIANYILLAGTSRRRGQNWPVDAIKRTFSRCLHVSCWTGQWANIRTTYGTRLETTGRYKFLIRDNYVTALAEHQVMAIAQPEHGDDWLPRFGASWLKTGALVLYLLRLKIFRVTVPPFGG